ncbi:Alpha/Beta hydrolase protein [Pisolithus marmoratus]|nr:Alpha/Beta hydrolase protein [Pisolithus marmoratus]
MADTLTDHCFTTVQHAGTPTGQRIDIDVGGVPVPTYLAEPKDTSSSRKIILYFSDVFGAFYANDQLLQDYFATQGFTVLGIDYFFGDSYALHVNDPNFDRPTWRDKSVNQAKVFTPGWVDAIKQRYGTEGVKYFAVGYCFGAPYVFDQGETGLLSAAAVAHPTALTVESVLKSNAPVLFSCAEIDNAFNPDLRRSVEDALSAKKATYYFQIFSGALHGFGTRADLSVESQRWAKEECARSVVQWFKRFSA